MRIHPLVYGFLVLSVFLGTIFGFQKAGFWSVSGKLTASGDQVQPDASDVESIKGWMTLEQVSTAYQIPLADLLSQFDLPADTPASTPIKDLETDLFSVTNLRTWIQDLAQPEEASQPEAASTIPTSQPSPTQVALPVSATETVEHIAPENTVTGKTTFQELLDWGVTTEAIRSVIGEDPPSLSMGIKDYVTSKGMAFSEIKPLLQAEVDNQ